MIKTAEALHTARGLLGTAYSELDCINFIRFCTFKADARKAK